MVIQAREVFKALKRQDQKRISMHYSIGQTTGRQDKERTWKAAREKHQTNFDGKPIRITANFLAETLQVKRAWNEVFQPRLLSVIIKGEIKTSHDKQKPKEL
jgi:hypothetical protein